ncbi:hypothetical protein PG990_009194 [Apiospora arundinis]
MLYSMVGRVYPTRTSQQIARQYHSATTEFEQDWTTSFIPALRSLSAHYAAAGAALAAADLCMSY